MNYYRQLAFELRRRGLTKSDVLKSLEEVRSYSEESGALPIDSFGPPKRLAESLGEGAKLPLGQGLYYLLVLLGVVQIIGQILIVRTQDLDPHSGPITWMWEICAGLCLVGFLLGQVIDRRLPAAFR